MRRLAFLIALTAPGLLAAASAPVVAQRETVDQALARAEAEARQAAAQLTRIEQRERDARDEAAKLAAERQVAAAEITLAEARLTAADAALAQARAGVALREQRLAQRRAPLAALLAGLATMGRRPPILAFADGASVAEVVRVRALIDTTMPLIARRSAALQAELGEGRQLAARADLARQQSALRRSELGAKLDRFAELENRALARAETLGRDAFGEQDRVIVGGEKLLDLQGAAQAAAEARNATRALAALPLAAPRPFAAQGAAAKPPLDYRLPADTPVVEGLGAVNAAGVRSRGLRFATPRGAAIAAPAAGTILFAGPFRDHDSILVIDHGKGWTSLLIGVAADHQRGDRVAAGEPLGHALGDITLELRRNGLPTSAALIAGSSDKLSNRRETR